MPTPPHPQTAQQRSRCQHLPAAARPVQVQAQATPRQAFRPIARC
jgi:hypothetical protein